MSEFGKVQIPTQNLPILLSFSSRLDSFYTCTVLYILRIIDSILLGHFIICKIEYHAAGDIWCQLLMSYGK